jgi:hypothetical protein
VIEVFTCNIKTFVYRNFDFVFARLYPRDEVARTVSGEVAVLLHHESTLPWMARIYFESHGLEGEQLGLTDYSGPSMSPVPSPKSVFGMC